MNLKRFTLTALALPFALLVPRPAHAGIEACNTEGSASCSASRSRERVPSPNTTIVPAIIVFAAIGAAVARMNRRGGPR